MPHPNLRAADWPDRAAAVKVTLHATPHQVAAHDLDGGDLVSLDLGDDHALVVLLGELGLLVDIVTAATDKLAAIGRAREARQ